MDLYKPEQLSKISELIRFTPKWFIVCGVGTGGEAAAAKKRWPECSVVGMEPAAEAYEAMKDHFPGTLVNKAAWLRKTRLELYSPDTLLYGNLFGLAGSSPPTKVEADTLDSLSAEIGPFDADVFLWMDVEYAEAAVLIGAAGLLGAGAIRAVNFENHPASVAPGKSLIVRELLASHGMKLEKEYEHEGGHHWDELWATGE